MWHKMIVMSLGLAVLAGCSPGETNNVAESAASSITSAEASTMEAASDLAGFTGVWQGPEGTSLTIKPQGTDYRLTIVNLDGPRDFTGTADGDGIAFTRDAQSFVIRKGTGDDTGMKWLAGKHDCVVVTVGEGYCHD